MASGVPVAAAGYYPERDDAPEPFFDRLLANLGYRWHRLFSGRIADPVTLSAEVARHAAEWTGAGRPAARIPDLRYRLRRDGFTGELVAECFGICCSALARERSDLPAPSAVAAARALLAGGVVELADAAQRRKALELAAAAWAVCGVPVHLMVATDARAQAQARALADPLAALGFTSAAIAQGMDAAARRAAYAAAVVCGTPREIAHDYLRDRVLLGQQRPLARALQRVAGESGGGTRQPVMRGLQCALIDDADVLMLDDAVMPIVLTGDAERPRERLLYEQAIELGRALAPDADFRLEDDGARLTDAGAQRIERLVGALGGVWAARQRREDVVALALDVLHRLERDRDYRVEQGRIVLVNPPDPEGGEVSDEDQMVLRLLEVKEGCKLGASPDVVARLSLPRFLRRYVHLSGITFDTSRISGEIWTLYRLKSVQVGVAAPPIHSSVRAFVAPEARRACLVRRAAELSTAGRGVVVAVRTMAEVQALAGVLKDAGMEVALLRGSGDPGERKALEQLGRGSGLALLLYPGERYLVPLEAPVDVIIGEAHDAWRHVQRVCRAFSADSCELLVAVEDATLKTRISGIAGAWARRGIPEGGELPARRAGWLVALAQRAGERSTASTREEMMARDQQMDTLLAFTGRRE